MTGERGYSVTGERGVAVTGDWGMAIAGLGGKVAVGEWGFALLEATSLAGRRVLLEATPGEAGILANVLYEARDGVLVRAADQSGLDG